MIFYLYVLNIRNFLLIKDYLLKNIIKIILCTIVMSIFLILSVEFYSDYLEYSYKYKSVYLMLIVGFAASIYLILSYLTGVLKIKNFKAQ